MSDCMTFPDTVEEYMEQYKVVDTENVYTNGAELVPIFRMKQWFEHLPTAQPGLSEHSTWFLIGETLADESKMHITAEQAVDKIRGYMIRMKKPERKKGKWITKSTGGEMFDCCSVCGYVEWDNPKNYCPNCGADMRGVINGNQ